MEPRHARISRTDERHLRSSPLRNQRVRPRGLDRRAFTPSVTARVAESPVNFECKVTDIVQLRSHTGVLCESWLVLGEVVAVHIDDALLTNGVFNTFGAGIILRGGGTLSLCGDPAGKPLRHAQTFVETAVIEPQTASGL